MSECDACLVCYEPLLENGTYPTCSECKYGYHLGACSGVSKTTFKKDDAAKKTWKCQTCLVLAARRARGEKSHTGEHELTFEKILIEINKKLAQIPEIQSKVDALMVLKNTVDKLELSVQHLSDQYDSVLAEMQKQATEITALKKRADSAGSSNTNMNVLELQKQVNVLEQYSRRQNIEIHGLPVTQNENLLGKLNNLATKLSLPELSSSEVEGVHRLPPKTGKVPVVLVRFASRATRDQWMAKKAELKAASSDVYFLGNLTPQNKKLLWLMKEKAVEFHF